MQPVSNLARLELKGAVSRYLLSLLLLWYLICFPVKNTKKDEKVISLKSWFYYNDRLLNTDMHTGTYRL